MCTAKPRIRRALLIEGELGELIGVDDQPAIMRYGEFLRPDLAGAAVDLDLGADGGGDLVDEGLAGELDLQADRVAPRARCATARRGRATAGSSPQRE